MIKLPPKFLRIETVTKSGIEKQTHTKSFFSAGFTSGAKPWLLKHRTSETGLDLLLEKRKLCFAIFDLLNLNILDSKKNISFCVTSHWIFYAALAKYKNPIKVCGGGALPQKVLISFLLYWASVRWQQIPLPPQVLALYFEIFNTDVIWGANFGEKCQTSICFFPLIVLLWTEGAHFLALHVCINQHIFIKGLVAGGLPG